jgi:hypothetical protein
MDLLWRDRRVETLTFDETIGSCTVDAVAIKESVWLALLEAVSQVGEFAMPRCIEVEVLRASLLTQVLLLNERTVASVGRPALDDGMPLALCDVQFCLAGRPASLGRCDLNKPCCGGSDREVPERYGTTERDSRHPSDESCQDQTG